MPPIFMMLLAAASLPGFTLTTTDDSPKHDFRVEKYSGVDGEGSAVWLQDRDGHRSQLWSHGGIAYEPFVHISPDEHWIVCVEQLYAGASAAWLYRRLGLLQYVEITPSPFSDRAWDFFRTETHRSFEETDRYRIATGTWFPRSHAMLVELSGDDGKTLVGGWYCYYDLEKGHFYLDSTLKKKNKGTVSNATPKT